MGVHHSVSCFKILVTGWTAGAVNKAKEESSLRAVTSIFAEDFFRLVLKQATHKIFLKDSDL